MRILYVSLHSVLEYDEVRLLRSLGHQVMSLGALYGGRMIEPLRDNLAVSPAETELYERFERMGGSFTYSAAPSLNTRLPDGFVELFDAVVVMHDISFIEDKWDQLSCKPVFWRTVGQDDVGVEERAGRLQQRGLRVIRYSPVERLRSGYCGEAAMIRFGKRADDYEPWVGSDRAILNFTNTFVQRYPAEHALFQAVTAGLPVRLGGLGNEALPGSFGMVTPQEQMRRYNVAGAYFYCSGWGIPYTLNFMEAMLAGAPVVCLHPDPNPITFEVPTLLSDGAGLSFGKAEEAREALTALLEDHALARRYSENARRRAIELFDYEPVGRAWQALFDRTI